MALFQEAIVKKYIKQLDEENVDKAFLEFKTIYSESNIKIYKKIKEEAHQGEFIEDIFGKVLGYQRHVDIMREVKNETNAKKADAAILREDNVIGVIELKDNKTKNLSDVQQQAFNYKLNHKNCSYVITSNFHKLRFYIDDTTDYEEFDLYNLDKESFRRFYLYLQREGLLEKNLPKLLRQETKFHEEEISKNLYKDYSNFKRSFFENALKNNPQFDKLSLFKKSQKFLDRVLFVLFAEDKGLVTTNSVVQIVEKWQALRDDAFDTPRPLYTLVLLFFNNLFLGKKDNKGTVLIPEFGGELFAPDEVLDQLTIDDDVLKDDLLKLSKYDFNTDVDVNILGHIFEHSLNEVDDVEAELRGEQLDKTKSKRKKDGVFYTPKYITKYIVDNTLGKLCSEKKAQLKLDQDIAIFDYQKTDGKLNEKGKDLFERLNTYKSWLLTVKVCDPACGSGAFLNQALSFFIEEHKFVDDLIAELTNSPLRLFDTDLQILENNIYGVDINEESVEIAKLSMWLRTAQPGRKLSNLSNNIKCGNSLIDDPEVAGDKAFNWEKEFPTVFEKGGFDVVIGNPPYVRQELFKDIKPFLKTQYKCYNGIADLYTYFIEKGISLINSHGLFSYILPNKFIKASYGSEIRKVMIEQSNLELLVDFDDFPIFEDATTYPIIFILNKSTSQNEFINYSEINNRDFTEDPITLIKQKMIKIPRLSLNENSWNFKSNNVNNVLEKLNKDSVPLSNFVKGKINRGVLTGKNDVFIFNEEFRNELLNKNAEIELIKPILLGSAIKRYQITYSNDYLLFTRRGIDIDRYPVIKSYLSESYDFLRPRNNGEPTGRKAGPYKWYEIQDNIAYFEDFESPKIVYPRTNNQCNFQLDFAGYYLSDNNFYIKSDSKTLLGLLNSKLVFFYLKSICTTLQGGYYDFRRDKIDTIPIPKRLNNDNKLEILVSNQMKNHEYFNKQIGSFSKYFSSKYSILKISGKLEKWHELDFSNFIIELNKSVKSQKGEPLQKKDEFEWLELFEENKKKVLELKTQIDQTDKEIDQMVYELYGLTEEEINIVETN